jgi:hypothetical protein
MKLRVLTALAISLPILSACADAPTDPAGDDRIAHSSAPDHVLVRVAWEGGFVPVEWTYTNLPNFSLYGDGTLIVPGAQIEIYPSPALPAISTRAVSEAGIQAILAEALTATEKLPANLDDMGSVGIADAPTTVISLSTEGTQRTVRVYALGELPERPEGMPEDVFRARRALQDLVAKLTGPDGWLPEGSIGAEEAYDATGARLFVGPHRKVEDLPQERIAWPLDVGLDGFGSPADVPGGYRCGTVTGSDWTTVRAEAERANQLTPWVDGGSRYSILFRPLLPDEKSC